VGPALSCVGETLPATEVCNGIDDDCNNKTDDVPGIGNACCRFNDAAGNSLCGTGLRTNGSLSCQPGSAALVCTGGTGPTAACCPAGVPCGTGICKGGTLQCTANNTALQCVGFTDKGTEVCNGLDDDCNGIVDDVPGSGASCCSSGKCGTGVCQSGVQKCVQD